MMRGFSFSAGEIPPYAEEQTVYQSYGHPSPFTMRIESATGSRQLGNPWRYSPRILPSLSDPSLPSNSRYSLLLLSAKQGYPLWRPEPNRAAAEEYRQKGVRIGDVGILRPDGFFDYLFNICLSKNDPVNAGGVPEGFIPVEFSERDVSEVDPFHESDAHVSSPTGYISKDHVYSEGINGSRAAVSRAYDFRSMNSEGAILMLPDGSVRIDLENKKIFRQYATRNAPRWYTYVEHTRGRESQELSLYIITGCDKTSSFGVASFCNTHRDRELGLRLHIDGSTHQSTWSNHNCADSRSGPKYRLGDPLGTDRPQNQCIFLRGFKLNKRQGPKSDDQPHRLQSAMASDPTRSTSASPSSPSSSRVVSNPSWTMPHQYPDPRRAEEDRMAVEYIPSHSAPYHPCDTINAFSLDLLSATPGAVGSGPSFAISHDDDWRSVWDETNPKLPTEQELIRRICSKYQFVIDNGTIYPDAVDEAVPRKLSPSPEESILARVLILLTCVVHKCGEQFSDQSLLITHMQQKHDVVHGTAARVPLSAAKASSASTAPKPPTEPHKKKRRGGVAALSCAECRRLKLNGCVKKGCAAICPDGHLTTGKGNRFVLASSNELQDKIVDLTSRAKVLEEALAKSHSLTSPQPHPLLSEDLLQIKRPLNRESPEPDLSPTTPHIKEEEEDQLEEHEAQVIHDAALGSLLINNGERSTFYGRTSTSWHFLLNENRQDQTKPSQQWTFKQPLPIELPWLAHSFPFAPPVDGSIRDRLIEALPKRDVARKHLVNYYKLGAWHYTPISEIDFKELIYRPLYEPEDSAYGDPPSPHDLAIMFFVVALGTLLDIDGPIHPPEARWYYHLGKAALALEPVLDSPALSTIQALILLSHYMLLDDIHNPRWPTMGLATKLTQAAGLHLDGTLWNLTPEQTYRRRCLFWEVYSYDILQSLTYGRPPHISLQHVNTKKPFETTRDANGEVEMTYAAWKHKFFGECLGIIWNKAFGAHPLSYDLLKHLDQQMRAYYVPPSLRVPGFGGAKLNQDVHPPSPELTMARHFLVALKEITSFYMHRGFFATAVAESPENPIEHHRYGESVQTIYDSACICVGLMRSLFRHQPKIMLRMWFFFDHIFSCAYVLAAIASTPKVHLALSALTNLELAYDLFDVLPETPRKAKIIGVLNKLRDKARTALNITRNPLTEAQKLARPPPPPIKTEDLVQTHSWPTHVSASSTSSTSPHQYSPSVLQAPFQRTYDPPQQQPIAQFPVDQFSVFPPTEAAQTVPHQYGDPFFQHPEMAYNPMHGYQYHDYQDAGYFQQQMHLPETHQGYDGSGDVIMPMLEENWNNLMNSYRQ